MFKSCVDAGFGIMEGNKKDVQTWINEFNNLHENIFIDTWTFGHHVAYMHLCIFKGNKLYETGKLTIKVYQNLKIVACILLIKVHIQDIR